MARAAKKQKTSHKPDPEEEVDALEDGDPDFYVYKKPLSAPLKKGKTTKAKLDDGHYEVHKSRWDARLDTKYAIAVDGQLGIWPGLGKKYNSFQTNPAEFTETGTKARTITTGECVLVRGLPNADDDDEDDGDERTELAYTWWYAQVLQIRATDPAHVYVLVAWLYKPEDLVKGKQDYHADNELIPSNDLEIVHAITVETIVDVMKWDPSRQHILEDARQETEQHLNLRFNVWRQTVAVNNGKQDLSVLDKYCNCKKHANPEELLIGCNHCERWMHEACIEKQVLKDYLSGQLTKPDDGHNPKGDTATEEETCTGDEEVEANTIMLGPSSTVNPISLVKKLLWSPSKKPRQASPVKEEIASLKTKVKDGHHDMNSGGTKEEDAVSTSLESAPSSSTNWPAPDESQIRNLDVQVIYDGPGEAPSIKISQKGKNEVEIAQVAIGPVRCLSGDCRKLVTASMEVHGDTKEEAM